MLMYTVFGCLRIKHLPGRKILQSLWIDKRKRYKETKGRFSSPKSALYAYDSSVIAHLVMFASQLLRILQTIPSDVKHETSVYDPAEQDMTMKENLDATRYSSKRFGRDADPLVVGSKETYNLNGSTDTNPFEFEVKDKDECWDPKFLDDFPMENEHGTRASQRDDQNALLYHLTLDEDADSSSSDGNDKDKVHSSPEHECSMTVEEFAHTSENESTDSRFPYIGASDLYKADTNWNADKNASEYERAEVIVCYKEINYHVVKEICIDERMPVKGDLVIESNKDDKPGHSFRQPLNDDAHCETIEGDVDMEIFESDGLEASSLESTKDTAEHCGLEDSQWKGETNSDTTGETATDASEDDSFIDRKLPIQEFGTRSFLRSFLNSLDGESNKVALLLDEKISSSKAVGKAAPAAAGPKEDLQASILCYNSEVENGSITFNFNSLAPVVAGVTNGTTEVVKEQSFDSGDSLNHKDANLDTSMGKVHELFPAIKHGLSNDSSATSHTHPVSSEDISDKDVHDQSPDHKEKSSDGLSTDSQLPIAINSIKSDGQAAESHVLEHEHKDFGNGSVVGHGKYEQEESSFSAAGLITFSGPIVYSGSLSVRSDGSAASGRSFAFPILQSEWNSSPVRMGKADGTHFRKHKVVSFLLAPCSSTASDQAIRQKPLQQYGDSAVHQEHFTLLSLPRKLNLHEEAAVGKKRQDEKEENMRVHDEQAAGGGTWREWVESPRRSEYFTMDYAWVRRRRPIHNKKIPFVP
ncbi:hypothetical protein Sango_2960700 [Sesamum angolense]|uniref:Uncharacterized protein n=1 Tax=Sesamum angolense TaxID=2727404 RepID=A0AAE1T3Z7_9LAMI|nr:hypothetical protein Sango_2960700 [Sesamum angolense]